MSDLHPKVFAGKNPQELLLRFSELDYRDPVGNPLHMSSEFMELVDMAIYGASRVADIQKDIAALREMLEAPRAAS